jgi:glucokinase
MADGPGCDCGNRGCLEAVCSGKSIGRRAEEAVCQHPRRGKFILDLAAGEEITAKVVFSAARQGDRLAREIVEETCTFLGMGIAAVVNGLAPDRVVIGGGVARAGGGLFEPLRIHAARFTMPVHRPHLCIVPARRGGNSVLMGASALAKKLL